MFNDGLKRGKEENEDEICPPGVRPNSGAKEEVCTRNSCMASIDTARA
jgi:hypothetical protein